MYGFNVTSDTFSYDNRPVAPLRNYTFDQWWFHGHLDYPPHPTDFFELPAGSRATGEIACDKGATSYFASAGADIRDPNDPDNVCPGSGIQAFHTTGESDAMGCALAIAYESNVTNIKPEDFVVFSVNQTYSGAEENYMNGFKCKVTNSTSDAALLATPQVARRCGADPSNNKLQDIPGNCTYGAKQPIYWFQAEQNTMFEGAFSPPVYNDLYNFLDGAQNDIFIDSYATLPDPSPIAVVPTLADVTLSLGYNLTNPNLTADASVTELEGQLDARSVSTTLGSSQYRVPGRDMLAYGYKTGEPWAEERRVERAFHEVDSQENRNYRNYRTRASERPGSSRESTISSSRVSNYGSGASSSPRRSGLEVARTPCYDGDTYRNSRDTRNMMNASAPERRNYYPRREEESGRGRWDSGDRYPQHYSDAYWRAERDGYYSPTRAMTSSSYGLGGYRGMSRPDSHSMRYGHHGSDTFDHGGPGYGHHASDEYYNSGEVYHELDEEDIDANGSYYGSEDGDYEDRYSDDSGYEDHEPDSDYSSGDESFRSNLSDADVASDYSYDDDYDSYYNSD
ncbi:hypothetical protein H0H92_000351 [Tricholoma furcatifolium]|nr:hypothetical protein H0H92_000351 [Tricholoma furcatifolium]